MRNVGILLTMTTVGLLSFSPIAAQSQEGAPSTSTQLSFHAHAEPTEDFARDTTALELISQNQPASAEPTEENAAEATSPEPAGLNQPGSVEQDEAQPASEGEQAETPTPTVDELYAQLEQSLDSQNWQQADQTTYELMLLIAGPKSEEQGYFDRAEWESFPCEQFQRIDSLWSEASQGRQGFAAQLTIFREVDNNPSTYFSRIGWQQEGKWVVRWQYNRTNKRAAYLPGMQPNFAEPPVGHLPALLQWGGGRDYRLAKANSCLVE